jgi:hypothetical protein
MHYNIPQEDPDGITLVYAGSLEGVVYTERPLVNDATAPIVCVVATRENCPDARAYSWFGDCGLDLLPTNNILFTAQATVLGGPVSTPVTFLSPTRLPLSVVDVGGGVTAKSLGLFLYWSQTYGTGETSPAVLYVWSPTFVPKPETIQGRFTDWAPEPGAGNKFFQGFMLEGDSNGIPKTWLIRDSDTLTVQQAFSQAFSKDAQQDRAFSFALPFVAHSARLEATDEVPWRLFNLHWITVPYPEAAQTWRTEGTAHGERGFQHLYMGQLAYISAGPVTLTLRFDQWPTITLELPATPLQLEPIKFQFKIPPNKFKIVGYEAVADAPFYLWVEDCEFWLGEWGREAPYRIIRPFGGLSKAPRALV